MSSFNQDYLAALAAADAASGESSEERAARKIGPRDFTFGDISVGDGFFFPDAPMTMAEKGPWIKKTAKSYAHAYSGKTGKITAPKQIRVTPVFKFAARVYAIDPQKKALLTTWIGKNMFVHAEHFLDAIPKISTLLYRKHQDGTWATNSFNGISDQEDAFIRSLPERYRP